MNEAEIIAALLRAAEGAGTYRPRTGAGDDGAVLQSGEVVTTDLLVEGVHFDGRSAPGDVGWKLVAVNASDVGAMGCRPSWTLLNLSLPKPFDVKWFDDFTSGFGAALQHFGVHLIGGDTTRSPGPIVLGLSMAGEGSRPVLRSGAQPGDRIWVSGALGEAAAGFYGLPGAEPGLGWLRRPVPPVALGAALGEARLVTAMMDLSDGLAQDLARLAAASGVGALVRTGALPRGPSLLGAADPVPYMVSFGDDYQLLFTAPPAQTEALQALGEAHGARLTDIGEITEGGGAQLDDRPWPSLLFEHF